MRSPSAAIAWEFRRRHRVAAIAFAVYALASSVVWTSHPHGKLDRPDAFTIAVLFLPLTSAFMYLLGAFSFGFDGDLAARASMFPRRLFTLPITTEALAGWPMLIGGFAMVLLWELAAVLGRLGWEFEAPLIWPACFAAAFLAWTQALTWSAYPLSGARIVATVLWLVCLDAGVILAVKSKLGEGTLVALLLPQLPLAYLAARRAVSRARRGIVPDWNGLFAAGERITGALARRSRPFASRERAQLWFEWRKEGWVLPLAVAMVLPFDLAFIYICRNEPPVMTFEGILFVLYTPPFLAGFAGAIAGGSRERGDEAFGATFAVTKPLTTPALIAAKFKAAAWSTFLTWLLVLVALPAGLVYSGDSIRVAQWIRDGVDVLGPARAAVFTTLVLLGLIAWTWRQLVQSLYIRLAGRDWLVRASVVARLGALVILFPLIDRLFRNQSLLAIFWEAWPWVLAALVGLKIAVSMWTLPRLQRSGLIATRTLLLGAASWLGLVLALYSVLVWLICTPPLVPGYVPMLFAILAVPLARVSAAPLALARGRHGGIPRAASGRSRDDGRWTLALIRFLVAVPVLILAFDTALFAALSRNNGVLVSSGETREYLLHVPRLYDPAKPTPLVISIHGAALWPAAERDISLWNRLSERDGFIVVYPSATSNGPRAWHMAPSSITKNVRFIGDLIDTLKASYNIDPARVYADGLSNGGGMAFVLSCTMPDRIAAVGLVASAQLLPFEWCRSGREVPMIAFHGTADRSAPFHGGHSWVTREDFADLPEFALKWARRNRCDERAANFTVAQDIVRSEYSRCASDASVVLYSVEQGGHTWPGGGVMPEWVAGRMTNNIDATALMWDFYRAHPRTRTAP